jgi:uncharacterized protein YbbC (DUF1343 family)
MFRASMLHLMRVCSFWLTVLLSLGADTCAAGQKVSVGADVLLESRLHLLKGKRVGLITNHTGRLSDGRYLVDALIAEGIHVSALFSPEHGMRGESAAGEQLGDTVDVKTGIIVYSLHGATRKPTTTAVKSVDVLVYDIQDVGARFYTYISTMGLAMEAAAENGIPFIVLDRPNPLGGTKREGPVLQESVRSFVGMYPIPVVYGLTCGELAQMINWENWLKPGNGKRTDLTVIPMQGWRRSMLWDSTGCQWIPPSPNIPTSATVLVYPATCLLEATNISEGRGTGLPFQLIGAPFVDGQRFADAMTGLGIPGVRFSAISFTPSASKHKGELCGGVCVEVTNFDIFPPALTGLHLVQQLHLLYPDSLMIHRGSFGRLAGSPEILDRLLEDESPQVILADQRAALGLFTRLAMRYELYP